MIDQKINNTLMLVNNTFAIMKDKAIKITKFIIQKQVYFLLKTSIKLNSSWVQITPNRDIILS